MKMIGGHPQTTHATGKQETSPAKASRLHLYLYPTADREGGSSEKQDRFSYMIAPVT